MSNIGVDNTANGSGALQSNTIAEANTAIGSKALFLNSEGSSNTATGASALFANTLGAQNTASGGEALFSNTIGAQNTATGAAALSSNTEGFGNTANGFLALFSNTMGVYNTATGYHALQSNTTGDINVAIGQQALNQNTQGDGNVALGASALLNNMIGDNNVAIGFSALSNNTGSANIALGSGAGAGLTTGNSNIVIGPNVSGVAGEANTLRIGQSIFRTFIAGIRGVTTGNNDAVNVVIDSAGQLGTMSSSRRFKKEIKPMDEASEAILALKPVTFHYKSDKKSTPQFGLVAEEVAEVNPDLVVRDQNGEVYTVRYDAVNAMLLNEFLKEHRKVQAQDRKIKEQETTIADLKNEMEAVIAHAKEQDAKIQKVSDQLQASNSAAQVVVNGP
jgi:Chaperone of endosialidase